MIGYYVHHHGQGHVNRALGLAQKIDDDVTGLSSLERPSGWRGPWIVLDRDDLSDPPIDPTARGHLHWVPRGDRGVSSRMSRIAEWLHATRPDLVVSDVSVEVALLCRLLGVPVVCVTQPGDRSDAAHRLAHGLCDLLVAFVPEAARAAVRGLSEVDRARLHCLGAVSAHDDLSNVASPSDVAPAVTPRSVVVLGGRGGGGLAAETLERARALTPGWDWTVLGGRSETWVDDPLAPLRRAEVVITHAGLGALADVATARRPAVVIPEERPHDEQVSTAEVLADGDWPAVVVGGADRADRTDWATLLEHVARLDGQGWSRWIEGDAASRFVELLKGLAGQAGRAGQAGPGAGAA